MSMRSPAAFLLVISWVLLLAAAGCTQTASTETPALASGTVATSTPSPATTRIPTAAVTAATQEDMVAFVQEAVAYAKANGKEKALAEFSNPNGSFVRGELYLYAYDFNGTTIAHPFNPEKIGVNRLNETDAKGNYFIRDLATAANNGSGFVEFYYINPAHNRTVEPKLGYVEKVDDTWFLGSGIYGTYTTPTSTIAADSTGTSNTSTNSIIAFAEAAKAYGLSHGKNAAVAEFNYLNGSFIRGDHYIFAYDYNGTVLAWPYNPAQIGLNRLIATDPSGYHHIEAMVTSAKNGSGWVTYQTQDPFHNNTVVNKTSYILNVDGTWFLGTGSYGGI